MKTQRMNISLDSLVLLFTEAFPQEHTHYKLMPASMTGKKLFLLSHNAKHAEKNAAALTALSEEMDHTGTYPDVKHIRKILGKQVINLLLLSANTEIPLEDIFKEAVRQSVEVAKNDKIRLSQKARKTAQKILSAL